VHLALTLDDGTPVLSSFDEEPVHFTVGDGTLAPGLESLLMDLPVGTDNVLLADGETVYGSHDPALVHDLPLSDLPADFSAQVGQVIAFDTPGGQQTAGRVLAVHADRVQIDFNHPLCQRGLKLRVKVLAAD
jgi:FKBP-type peptidyl-prolyl cis-trans isomerase SlpA